MMPCRSVALATGLAALGGPGWAADGSGYTYVKMSLAVPWTLYFVFLACVLIPFVVMIVLAWRGASRPEPTPKKDAVGDPPAAGAP